jgi:hypothetical protein
MGLKSTGLHLFLFVCRSRALGNLQALGASRRFVFRLTALGNMKCRVTMKGKAEFDEGTPHTELLQGTMPAKELKKLETLLQDPEFRALPRSSGGILRKGAETFVAEVPRRNGVQRVVISDTEGENPFPHSA